MILSKDNIFLLQTRNTSYLFSVMKSGHLEHLHYGKSLMTEKMYENLVDNLFSKDSNKAGDTTSDKADNKRKIDIFLEGCKEALSEKHSFASGNAINYSDEFGNIALENTSLEISSVGKGDIRDPFVLITHTDGSITSDFLFEKAEIVDGIEKMETLPCSYGYKAGNKEKVKEENKAEYTVENKEENREDKKIGNIYESMKKADQIQHLKVTLVDKEYNLRLYLYYNVYPDCDVITKRCVLVNDSKETVHIDRLMSNQIDFHKSGLVFASFHGRWADEMSMVETVCDGGRVVSEEMAAGESGSRSNPFVMVMDKDTTQDFGDCYGFNLIYSGNHYEALSSNGYDKSRFISGISPMTFGWKLEPLNKFEAPEAVMTFSVNGKNKMSYNMHSFVRKHIVRGRWRDKERPVLVNSWEASYMNFNEKSLLKLAKEAANLGIELFVLDDGWFGQRDDDKKSLGDWHENRRKLPNGLKGLSKKVRELGLLFGIWVEPEMVNEDSDLYRKHPSWAVKVKSHHHSKGRNQMNLDISRIDVQDYIIESMSKVFKSADISYVKWDMNRIFSDYYSAALPNDRQDEFIHRYYIGLYRIMDELTSRFPDILFEGCSAGGNRFDLGILSYFPQIWGSDDTDAFCRARIQRGYSYGYPQSCMGAHVSAAPNHQTLNSVPLDTRFNVAAFGCFGYELNLCDLSLPEKKEIASQIAFYKEWRRVFQFGNLIRLEDERIMAVDDKKERAIALLLQRDSRPNRDITTYKMSGLDNDAIYHFTNRYVNIDLKAMGSLINTMNLPIHVKQDGVIHTIANSIVTLKNEEEDCKVSGCVLNSVGVRLLPKFSGIGFGNDGKTGILRTGDSRLYMMQKI